jgi:hypothetical protein
MVGNKSGFHIIVLLRKQLMGKESCKNAKKNEAAKIYNASNPGHTQPGAYAP